MKEKSHLITQSLIESVKWYMTAPNSIIKPDRGGDGKQTWKEKAFEDLKATVTRAKTDFPEAARRGVAFEDAVYEAAESHNETKGSEKFREVVNMVKGYQFRKKGGVTEDIEGYKNCYLYIKTDAVTTGKIIDIKTTSNYSFGKYLKTIQGKLYCHVTKIPDFTYIIAEWAEYPNIKEIYMEKYFVEDFELLKSEVHREIVECFETLKDLGLWEDYRDKYCLY